MISKGMGEIKWDCKAKEIEQLIRGLNPWPSVLYKSSWENVKALESRGFRGYCPQTDG